MTQPGDRTLTIPDAVAGKARALGAAGDRWLRSLPGLIHELEQVWDIRVGAGLGGGSAAYVALATIGDGSKAVLKLAMPGYGSIADEIRVLSLAGGRGYARLLRADVARSAVLLERLGPRLSTTGYPVPRQIERICATLAQAWMPAPDGERFLTGADRARWHQSFLAEAWPALGCPCEERLIEEALAHARNREAAFDPATSVLVHGDVHSGNLLACLGPDGGPSGEFKLVDPDGLIAERAYDAGLALRDWREHFLAGDARALGQEYCAQFSRLTGVDAGAIWEWAFIERVSTGLFLMQTGGEREGRDMLRVAEAWASPR